MKTVGELVGELENLPPNTPIHVVVKGGQAGQVDKVKYWEKGEDRLGRPAQFSHACIFLKNLMYGD